MQRDGGPAGMGNFTQKDPGISNRHAYHMDVLNAQLTCSLGTASLNGK